MGPYGSAEAQQRIVEIQNLLSHPDDINCDDEFAVTHPDEIPTSVKWSEWHKMEGLCHPDDLSAGENVIQMT